MTTRLRLLLIDDDEDEQWLIEDELRHDGYEPEIQRVDTAPAMTEALEAASWDLLLVDWTMPGFSAPEAFQLYHQYKLDCPFIIISGMVKEDTALALLSSGVHDFIAKHNRLRLLPAIHRELAMAEYRRRERESNRLVRALLDSTAEAVYGLDMQGNSTFVNPACVRLLGYGSADELVGRNMHELMHHTRSDGSPYPETECPIYSAFRLGNGAHIDSDVLWRADGSSFPAEYWSYPIHDGDQIIGAVVTFLDITERKLTESKLRQSQRMEAVGQLTGGIAHDFNNLLGIMLGNTEMLGNKVGDDKNLKRHVDALTRAINRASSLTKRLLAFSRRQPLAPKTANVATLFADLGDMLRRTLGETISVSVESSDNLKPVFVDPHQLDSALVNLAINSRDAMPDGGALIIEISNAMLDKDHASSFEEVTPGDYVLISTTDTGVGMSPEVQSKVFEPFFTTKPFGKSSGLGLSMVFGFIKQSKGHISIASKQGKGTTVSLYLPVAKEYLGEKEDDRSQTNAVLEQKTVLSMEDEPDVRETISRI